MIFDISYEKALRIQRAQIAFYRQMIGRKGIKCIRKNTKPCPENIHPEEPVSIFLINELVPRGGNFESLFQYHKYKTERDPTNMAMHEAIMKGLL